jgi:hypothetical protein
MLSIGIDKWTPQTKEYVKIWLMVVVSWGTLLSILVVTVTALDVLKLR